MKPEVETPSPPLAERMRPTKLGEVIGQDHLVGEGMPLNLAFESGQLHSMILWGPPGVGKTTIARLAATYFKAKWIPLSAVLSGVKDIRMALQEAQEAQKNGQKTIVFVDEIHRFNKAQQDALLPETESGLITLIGATTENPSFEVIPALISRSQVYVLKSLDKAALEILLAKVEKALQPRKSIDSEAKEALIGFADGDGRRLINLLEQIESASNHLQVNDIDLAFVKKVMTSNPRKFDKKGDHFYDQISALHKSVRGSNPDAALYWLSRLLDGGMCPKYISRRIIRMSWEDIGLADPRAVQIALDAASTYERLGSPEGELALGQAVVYLSIAAKSNAGYKAFNEAMDFVKKEGSRSVPLHLRNAPTRLMKSMGHGAEYRYAHDETYGYAAGEHYLPEGMKEPGWYKPVDRGLEKKIKQKMEFLRDLDEQSKG